MGERFYYDQDSTAYHRLDETMTTENDTGEAVPLEPPAGWVEVPRLPEDGEHWDQATASFITNEAIAADMGVPADHKVIVHAQKTTEAAMILSGVALTHGFLFEEAQALGLDLAQLATEVHAKNEDMRKLEVARRCKKMGHVDPT